jgi:hypothetical protein
MARLSDRGFKIIHAESESNAINEGGLIDLFSLGSGPSHSLLQPFNFTLFEDQ